MNFKKTVTIALAAGALTALAVPAMAETSFYGSARMTTFWNTVDSRGTVGKNADFQETLQANSRLGINFADGNLGGKVEMGIGTGTGATVSTRHMYGTYKFDIGTVLVGQTENPYYFSTSSVAKEENVGNGLGSLWDTREPQIKFTMNNGLYINAIMPTSNTGVALDVKASRNYLPKMNIGYEGKMDNFAFGTGVVGQTYKQTTAVDNDTVNSFMGYVHGTLKSGPAELKFNVGAGKNMGNMGFVIAKSGNSANKNVYLDGKDTFSYEGFVQGTYKLSDMLSVAGGFAYAADDNSNYTKVDNRMQIFVNAPITLAKGFSITPELSYIDQLNDKQVAKVGTKYASAKGEKEYLVGAKWQINF